ncbi:PadR family transcriptional regulator [Neobacillus endophyticus]|uniref:PadR family transcriptional regulator n=1 Tax=Neobacillus endophyticus TaxID=2738405 RepID=UPI0035E45C4F
MDSLETGELTDTAYYILLSLVEARHGYLIMKYIEKITNNGFIVGPASIYTTIRKLLDANLIEEVNDGNEKRKSYIATQRGIKLLKNAVQRRRQMVNHAEEVLKNVGRES